MTLLRLAFCFGCQLASRLSVALLGRRIPPRQPVKKNDEISNNSYCHTFEWRSSQELQSHRELLHIVLAGNANPERAKHSFAAYKHQTKSPQNPLETPYGHVSQVVFFRLSVFLF